MNLDALRDYCLSKENVSEDFPFNESTLVFKVNGKMFALVDIEVFDGINLKCDPEKAMELREQYAAVQPGYHMNKKHWNTIVFDGSIPDRLLKQWIDHSYELVGVKPLSKRKPKTGK